MTSQNSSENLNDCITPPLSQEDDTALDLCIKDWVATRTVSLALITNILKHKKKFFFQHEEMGDNLPPDTWSDWCWYMTKDYKAIKVFITRLVHFFFITLVFFLQKSANDIETWSVNPIKQTHTSIEPDKLMELIINVRFFGTW